MAWIIVLIILCFTRATVAQRTYYVSSNEFPVLQCPVENCYNMTELLNSEILRGNVTNVTLLLLPGIHSIMSDANTVFSIDSATNFTIRAANSSTGATIRCNGNVGFEFHLCINMTICDITIENCGALGNFDSEYLPKCNFSMYISHSIGVYMSNVHVINGTGIGLLLENIYLQLLIMDSILSHNDGNLYVVSYDNSKVTSMFCSMRILNSSLNHARSYSPKKKFSGVTIRLYQMTFHTEIELRNVNLVNNKLNMYSDINLCNSVVKLNNLTSVNINMKKNIYFDLKYPTECIGHSEKTHFTMDNANITGGTIDINGNKEKRHLVAIYINNTNISQSIISASNVKNILLSNVVIENSDSHKIMYIQYCSVNFRGYTIYQNNEGTLVFKKSDITADTYSRMIFRHNQAPESTIFSTHSYITMMTGSSMIFESNIGKQSGGVTLLNSTVKFEGNNQMKFHNNTGKRGGAMAFYIMSQLIFVKGLSNLTFIGNHASIVGGAIFVQDCDYVVKKSYSAFNKFIEVSTETFKPNITFRSNTAIQAGSMIYGGTGNKKDFIFDNSHKDNLSRGSTDPFMVCVCKNLIPKCISRSLHYNIMPGQPFKIDLVAVGQWNGVVPASIQLKIKETSNAMVKANEYIQSAGRHCTKFAYTFILLKQYDIFHLQVITPNRNPVSQKRLFIQFFLQNCTLGFSFENESRICVCSKVLRDYGIECDIETLTIQRPSSKWVNATFDHLPPSDQSGVIVHKHCPYDYCMVITDGLLQQLNLYYPNQQCAFSRSGILCGGCEVNFSQVLGTSKCKVCTNSRLLTLVFSTALAGVALVVGLILLNMTVSTGTINGLIFYVNILKANHAFFFPHLVSGSYFSIFIAWLNLDLGIETCFYDGMDAYARTWLQFIFPLYIWFIVTAIIVITHHSTKASKLIGKNPVQVLATLFLLSYAKMLHTIITIFSSTQLTYPDGYIRRVWLYDGNVDFLNGKHIPLFIAALLFLLFISIPFTATLMSIQWLQRFSHHKLLVWVIKLQPLFDAYTGPYKIKHRYWTGLLLLIRVCLFLVFSLNTFGDPVINLLTVIACMFTLFAYLSIIGGVYKLWWINLIETAFIMNLGLVSAAGLYKVAANVSITPITYTSTGIAFLLFVAIVSYHLIANMSQTKCGQILIARVKKTYHSFQQRRITIDIEEDIISDSDSSDNIVTYSEVELTEPLLVTD